MESHFRQCIPFILKKWPPGGLGKRPGCGHHLSTRCPNPSVGAAMLAGSALVEPARAAQTATASRRSRREFGPRERSAGRKIQSPAMLAGSGLGSPPALRTATAELAVAKVLKLPPRSARGRDRGFHGAFAEPAAASRWRATTRPCARRGGIHPARRLERQPAAAGSPWHADRQPGGARYPRKNVSRPLEQRLCDIV